MARKIQRRIDLELAASGYLRGPNGELRRIPSLDAPARDAVLHGIRAYWGSPELPGAGVAYPWSQVIVLSPHLLNEECGRIVHVFAHELAHCVVGTDHQRAEAWQRLRYGEPDS